MSYFVFWDRSPLNKLKGEHSLYFVKTSHGLEHAEEIFSWETKLNPSDFTRASVASPLNLFEERTFEKGQSVKFLNFSSFKI